MRWIVGLLLVAAALLKGLDLYLHPASVLADSTSQHLLPLLIGCELGLGLWAITDLHWNRLRVVAILLFASFASYSLWLALHGAVSCGCFGPLKIHPWWTFFLDFTVIAGLLGEYFTTGRKEKYDASSTVLAANRLSLIFCLLLPIAITATLVWRIVPQANSSQEAFQTVGDLVLLQPENWVGQKFPLLSHISTDLSHGNWVLLLHRHDCPKCQEAVPKYERLAELATPYQIALAEVPPYNSSKVTHASACQTGRLSGQREWFVETPVEIQLEDGVVASASTELPFLTVSHVGQDRTGPVHSHTVGTTDQLPLNSRGPAL